MDVKFVKWKGLCAFLTLALFLKERYSLCKCLLFFCTHIYMWSKNIETAIRKFRSTGS